MGTYIKNSCGGNCSPTLSCSACSVKVKRKSATLNLVGFSPFTCPNTPAPAPSTPITRYLQYRVNCSSAQVGCGTPTQKSATTTYTIDPFTGLQCVSGDVSVGCGCVNSSNDSFTCSPTSQTTNCGPATITEGYEGCTDQADAQGNNTISLTLLQSYTINDVVTKVDSMLSGNPLDDVMKFPAWNSDAQILAGTGGSTAVSWQPVSACSILSTLYYKSDYSVTKSELKLEFLGKTKVKVFFTSQDGGAATLESTTEYNKDQSVTITAPSAPGVRTLELVPEGSSDFSTFSSSVTPVTTGQRVSKVRNPPAEGETPFAGFIGPDCKRYAVMTTENSYSLTEAAAYTLIDPGYEGTFYESDRNDDTHVTVTDSITGRTVVYGGSITTNVKYNRNECVTTESTTGTMNADGTVTYQRTRSAAGCGTNPDNDESMDYSATDSYYDGNTNSYAIQHLQFGPTNCNRTSTSGGVDYGGWTDPLTTTTEQVTVSGSSITSMVNVSWTSTFENGSQSYNRTQTSTTTWSGEMTDTLTPANSTTTSWESNGGLCSWITQSADEYVGTESQSLTANFNVSVTVPTVAEPTPPTNYKTQVHWFVVTNDSSNPNCPTRSVRAENRTKFNSVRGPFSLTESATLPTDLNVTHCITNMAASTEVQL